jgi:hypothetical protein
MGKDYIKATRQSIGHGVASPESYTRDKAIQVICTLDQLYFYLS